MFVIESTLPPSSLSLVGHHNLLMPVKGTCSNNLHVSKFVKLKIRKYGEVRKGMELDSHSF